MPLFHSAALKLTMWYLLILMTISITFSAIIYQISSNELGRGIAPKGREYIYNLEIFEDLQQQRFEEGRRRLLVNLMTLNLFTLAIGGGASYLLARRTLSPIKEAMDDQGRFTSDASHELRTPLTSMRSEIEIALRDKKLSAPAMRKLLESNLEEVDKLRSLSDRLLLLTSEKQLALGSLSLDDVATEALNRVVALAQAKDITIENVVGRLNVIGSLDSLADLVTILLDNAIKYSPEKTQITIGSELQGKSAVLYVQDQGKGILASEIPHIFDRFYRADPSRNKQHVDGHGLGLAIAKRIAELHGTKITVTSTPGKGSTFSIKLPLSSGNIQ